MEVERWNNSASVLSCSGDRWRMTTNAMPESTGIALKNSCNALMLPAEPPRPTTGSMPLPLGGMVALLPAVEVGSASSGYGAAGPGSEAGAASWPAESLGVGVFFFMK
jgi:hypothetical protein